MRGSIRCCWQDRCRGRSDLQRRLTTPLQTFVFHHMISIMRLRDYFAGQRLYLRSPLRAETVAGRLNKAAGSTLWPFTTGVVGGVWSGHVRLKYRSSLFEYNAKPVLAGRLAGTPTGSSFDLCYRALVWVYAFYLVWYLFLCLCAVLVLSNGSRIDFAASDTTLFTLIFAILSVTPIGLHVIGTRHSEKELADLLNFLAKHAEVHC